LWILGAFSGFFRIFEIAMILTLIHEYQATSRTSRREIAENPVLNPQGTYESFTASDESPTIEFH
jgi:hypothetical protein